jgi:CPA2 family monovalent cation:H+ antiporter-2
VLDTLGVRWARLVVVAHDDVTAARKLLAYVRSVRPDVPVMVRTRDESHVEELLAAGATEVVPETIEASIMIASQALMLVGVPLPRVIRRMRELQTNRYQLMREMFPTEHAIVGPPDDLTFRERLHTVPIPEGAFAVGRRLDELQLECREVQALIRNNARHAHPDPDTVIRAGDSLVLFGPTTGLKHCEKQLLSGS